MVAVRAVSRGKHTGEPLGVEDTGREVELRAADFHQVVDGRIVRTWHLEDYFSIATQLGLEFTRAFAPGMRAAGWGRVVNTGSGITLTRNRDLAYKTSKGTVHGLTRALANGLGDSGITVNATAPGLVATQGFLGRARPGGPTTDEAFACVTALQTIERQSVAADLGNALGLLVSDDADFITGQILHGDGGMTRTGA
ncbi:SDR family oxidoreductase [Streptomyces sp. NPDC057340]|uniref:SDR family oxidoreductase n=1 Tax=Streptomyces sp. NPDC057340 TaxID=3346103 RepID=UPI003632D102